MLFTSVPILFNEDFDKEICQLMQRGLHIEPRHQVVQFLQRHPTKHDGTNCVCSKLSCCKLNDTAKVEDATKLNLQFNLHNYKPEEISVKIVKNKLKIEAKHEEKTDTKYIYNEFHEEFTLPEKMDLSTLKTTFNENGMLSIEGQLPQEEAITSAEKIIPIQLEK